MYIENGNLDKMHAQINYKNGVYFLKDLKSSTGTWIKQGNYDPILINVDMEVQIGGDIFSFNFG